VKKTAFSFKFQAAFPKVKFWEGLFKPVFFAAALLFLGACESLPFNYYLNASWSAPGEDGTRETLGTVRLEEVSVDRSGGWASVEKEIRGLAPLFFWERGYRVVSDGEGADYAAGIRAREREYASGWQTRRSLAMEVRLWPAGAPDGREPGIDGPLPLAAGRVTSGGNRSFSSSETTGRMLAMAIKKALRPLEKKARALKKDEGRYADRHADR
jgi:hypothetical protein